jgi:putative glutathione S-transferase
MSSYVAQGGRKLSEMPVLWAYARDLFQTPGFGDTVDFVQIKQHYYIVHADINPTRVVPDGPELSNWLTPHKREALGGRPFGDGTPPGRTPAGEVVSSGHGA